MKNQKITDLNTYSTNNTLHTIRKAKRKKAVRRRATAIVIAGLILIGLAGAPVLKNIQATGEYEKKATELVKKLEETEEQKKKLEYQVSLLEDEEYIAKLARKELNLSKENEILINIPELDESPSEPEEEEDEEKETAEK